jgi:haloacetate dehalogenase
LSCGSINTEHPPNETLGAMNTYRRCFENPRSVLAACEDYRAGLGIDTEHDLADRDAGRKITCPMLVVWSQDYRGAKAFDPKEIWEKWALNVQSFPVPAGHFPLEEEPIISAQVLLQFFAKSN